jgi:acetylornithine deacetylase/succinyl-diaminopimelate desuccinylase-like protein
LGVDEEYGFGGAQALVKTAPHVAGLVIGEPTGLRVVTAHKGVYRFWAQFDGEAAHAALPGRGINAIAMASAFIDRITREYIPDLNMRRRGLLGPPTINVAHIEGGIQPNLVPPVCRVQFERRMLPGETPATVQAELEALALKAARRFPQMKAAIEPPTLHAAAFESAQDSPLARAACEVVATLDRDPRPIGVDYATDACVLGALNVPTIICGPGDIGQAHTRDEFIEVDELLAGARFHARLMGCDCAAS